MKNRMLTLGRSPPSLGRSSPSLRIIILSFGQSVLPLERRMLPLGRHVIKSSIAFDVVRQQLWDTQRTATRAATNIVTH